jgi:predicted metal-dependent HD superfamily phosphohydrolase
LVTYTRSDRFYHDINHINDGLNNFEEIRHLAEDPNSLEMAWWWHDFVYDTRSSTNELNSALKAGCILVNLGIQKSFRHKVIQRIVATKHDHIPNDFDSKLIVDIDMASLGTPPNIFDQNTSNIRQEYLHISDEEFRVGRIEFFRKFLASQPSIYLTDYFRDKYEAQAQENLRRLLG